MDRLPEETMKMMLDGLEWLQDGYLTTKASVGLGMRADVFIKLQFGDCFRALFSGLD